MPPEELLWVVVTAALARGEHERADESGDDEATSSHRSVALLRVFDVGLRHAVDGADLSGTQC